MMSKFWFLTLNSFKKKVKSKWFVVINLLILVGLVGIMNIDSIIKAFGGDFDDSYKIVVKDNTGYAIDDFKDNLNAYNEKLDMGFTFDIEESAKQEQELEKEIEDSSKVLIVFDNTNDSYLDAKVVSDSTINTGYYQLLYQALTGTKASVGIKQANIDINELMKISSPISIDRVILDENKTTTDEDMEMIMGGVFPTVILPVFILVILIVQMIGAEINEEKQTRSMEVIISNVSPKVHFFSKMVASNAFVLMQGLLLILYAAIAILIKKCIGLSDASSFTKGLLDIWHQMVDTGFVNKLYYIVPATLILMILSFIVYSLIAGILASMTTNAEDYQHVQTPLVFILLVGYYLATMAGVFEGATFIKVLSFFPLVSAILSPSLLVLGQIGIAEIMLSIGIMIIFIFILVKYGMRIYKVGILNYSSANIWKKIFSSLKQSD